MTRTAAERRSPHTESTRVLLASPLAEVIAADLAADHHVEVVRTPRDLASTVIGRLRHDVVVADLIWQHGDLVRSFDGLDVVAALSEVGREAPVLLGLSGIPAEQDHLAEGLTLPAVRGVIAKRSGLPRLRAAIDVLAQGGRDFDDCQPDRSRLLAAPAIHQLFDASHLCAAVAGAIASRQTTGWADIADLTGYATRTVQSAPQRFADLIVAMDEAPEPEAVNQAVLFRWCGEHAPYILSWCRRHGRSAPSARGAAVAGGGVGHPW